jgi:hypothetical protein
MSDSSQAVGPAAQPIPEVESFIQRIWPRAIIGFALGITIVWACMLGYGFGRLIWLLG